MKISFRGRGHYSKEKQHVTPDEGNKPVYQERDAVSVGVQWV